MSRTEKFLKYGSLSIFIQFVVCFLIWVAAISFTPTLDPLFGIMVFFYWPIIYLLSVLTQARGESSMIMLPIFGTILGIVVYGIAFGLIVSFLKERRSSSAENS